MNNKLDTSSLALIGRTEPLFDPDLQCHESELREAVSGASFLVIGGAGSIGQAVSKEILARGPRKIHVVDISENNLVELVRDIRSTFDRLDGEFRTFVLDTGSPLFPIFMENEGPYDYVLNLSAMKHVRSERDPYTLMRLLDVNILSTDDTLRLAARQGARKYFAVSTDKATNPVNLMGASKRIMELFLVHHSKEIPVSTARFANVAFSDGSLLHGFRQRLQKRQPLAAPSDICRYFITQKESGELCLISCLLGKNREILFPKLENRLRLINLEEITERFLIQQGYQPYRCTSEQEARESVELLAKEGRWPCYFSPADTTGEKPFEEFYRSDDRVDWDRFETIGVLSLSSSRKGDRLEWFRQEINRLKQGGRWEKWDIVALFTELLPEFEHRETGRTLDDKM